MIVIMLVFLIFVSLWTRKQRGHPSVPFLFGLVLSWTLAFLSFLMILGNQSLLFMMRRDLFPIDWVLLSRLPAISRRVDLIVTTLNIGVASFYFSFLAFAIATTRSTRLQRYRHLIWLSIPLLAGVIIFDPGFIRLISQFTATQIGAPNFNITAYLGSLRMAFRIIHPAYYVAGVLILLRYTWARPRLRPIQRSIEIMNLAVVILGAMFVFFFFGHPQILAIPTLVPEYTRVAAVDIPTSTPFVKLLPAAQVVVLSMFAFGIVHYMRTTSADVYHDTRIRHSLRIASLGGRVMGHSMKNQLLAIESELELVQQDFSDENGELQNRLTEVSKLCRRTYESLDRSTNLLTAPRLDFKVEDIAKIAHNSVDPFVRRHAEISFSFRNNAEYTQVYADRFHLSEVVLNLIRNAADAVKQQQSPTIQCVIYSDARWISIGIRDNGPGLDAGDLAQVFEPFFSRNNSSMNWGIGLTYCHYVIEGHEGKIGIHNVAPRGAEAVVSLPLA